MESRFDGRGVLSYEIASQSLVRSDGISQTTLFMLPLHMGPQ